MAEPFWTVIVPVKGVGPHLGEALRSVLSQCVGDTLELLVQCNDVAAFDGVGESVRATDPTPLAWHSWHAALNPADLGCYGSVNAALKRACGRWVHVLHDDDYVLPGFYATMRGVCESLPPPLGAASCRYANDADGTLTRPPWLVRPAGAIGGWLARQLVHANPLQVPAVVTRRSAFDRVGPFRDDMPYAGDWEFYARLLTKFDWHYHPADLARYRLHPGQRCHAMLRDGRAAKDCAEARRLAAEYLKTRKAVTA